VFFGFAAIVLVYRPEVREWFAGTGQEKEFGADPVAAYGWPRD
jgi:hypothetical protein